MTMGKIDIEFPLEASDICHVNYLKLKSQKMTTTINVPTRDQVSANNQAIFDKLHNSLGFVPNLYATFAHSKTALEDYLNFQNRKTSLNSKEKEVINLAVSQVNECAYCLAAHTAIAKLNGFSDNQILELRLGKADFNSKLNALANFARKTALNRGKAPVEAVESLIDAGYTRENLIDAIIVIGDKTISNYLHSVTKVPVDFPLAPELQPVAA